MEFQPPANQDGLSDRPDLRDAFRELWNSEFMGNFVAAAARNPNYVDPRDEAPTGESLPVPWNGFPRLLSRFYRDSTSEQARARADEVADVLTPWLYWLEPGRFSERALGSRSQSDER